MPTLDELTGLYDKSESYRATQQTYIVHLTKLIELSDCCPWASDTSGSKAARFYFTSGHMLWGSQSYSLYYRALPVRSGTGSDSKVSARDGNFIAYSKGVVYDNNTGLEWYAGPDRNTTWNEAKAWVESLSFAGGGWRMPTREELKTLYKKGAGTRNMMALLKTTGGYVWSESRDSSSAWTLSCQNQRSKHFNCHYIYRICYKNAKKGKPDEMDLPFLKNDITGSELTVKMLDT